MKNIFSAKDKVVSSAFKQIFDCVYLDPDSPNVTHLINCSRYSVRHAGKTGQINEDKWKIQLA